MRKILVSEDSSPRVRSERLAGDGTYETTITVGVPTFGRATADRDMWMKPVTTKFHFKLTGGKVVEVSEPVEETRK